MGSLINAAKGGEYMSALLTALKKFIFGDPDAGKCKHPFMARVEREVRKTCINECTGEEYERLYLVTSCVECGEELWRFDMGRVKDEDLNKPCKTRWAAMEIMSEVLEDRKKRNG